MDCLNVATIGSNTAIGCPTTVLIVKAQPLIIRTIQTLPLIVQTLPLIVWLIHYLLTKWTYI